MGRRVEEGVMSHEQWVRGDSRSLTLHLKSLQQFGRRSVLLFPSRAPLSRTRRAVVDPRSLVKRLSYFVVFVRGALREHGRPHEQHSTCNAAS